ncbi:uncharacterized protein PpBr36_10317 [Pyricularia pennisetigena]|uniref:uncharacterized protein n=1 Tax=Pyricularia pennisetigena TaxID=1578925 RepID=UPI001154F819|nr:uncharacterized protein PpBr36_10317 [Pyricularia pennisetigena]TLS21445.1 hypothetical protein PpBr36_10317 [Pyricularia pennisetigena]
MSESDLSDENLLLIGRLYQRKEPTGHIEDEGGFRCSVQTFYEGPPRCSCCKNWVEDYADDLRETIKEAAHVEDRRSSSDLLNVNRDGGGATNG